MASSRALGIIPGLVQRVYCTNHKQRDRQRGKQHGPKPIEEGRAGNWAGCMSCPRRLKMIWRVYE
jgi:hypothetical protein